jgi:hypothetical protein
MIKSFTQASKYVNAFMGSSSDPYFSMSAPSSGMLRFNGDTRNFEVYNGSTWMTMNGTSASVSMTSDAEQAISWAIQKMAEEKEYENLAKTNQAVKIALDNLEQARQQLNITATLAREYEQTTS